MEKRKPIIIPIAGAAAGLICYSIAVYALGIVADLIGYIFIILFCWIAADLTGTKNIKL